ncbi:hypothetical protein [Zoogloea sp. LCSB751]|uniref:beta strand repeat-containing protein n=1 Tax=Zoogloea sp. LCSB751 TaxID=1965277 RepID=UPI0009A4D053|nr:hypothetical protein [Zoogloea sp. LCSB751]
MALNTAQQDLIVKTVVGVFDAAPGATYLNLLAPFGSNQTALVNALVNTDGFKAIYPDFYSNEQFATKFLDALVGSTVNATDKGNVATYAAALLNGGASRANVVLALINALDNVPATDATWGAASKAFDNQVTVAKYYTINQLGSATSIASLQSVIAGVTNTTDVSSNAAIEAAIANSGNSNGQTLTLTDGVDTIVGTSGNDTISATNTTAKPVLGGLDSVDGGAGTDTLAIADTATAAGAAFSFPAGFTVKNVEVLKVTTNGSFGDTAAQADLSGIAGLTSVEITSAGNGTTDTSVKVADTTDLTLVSSAAQVNTINGGKVVSVTGGAATSTITGAALTSVTLTQTGGQTIDNIDTVANGSTTAKGTTLTTVTLDTVNSDTAIKGQGLTTVTIKGATATAAAVNITNAKVGHALTLNVDGTGYTSAGAAQAAGTGGIANTTVSDAAAKSVTVNATGSKSALTVSTGAGNTTLTSATITGSAALALNLDSTNNTKLATIDGSAATGDLTLSNTAAATTIKTGSGNDTFSATVVGTSKATIDAGAGNDKVTLAGGLVAGSTVNLGAGNDSLLGTTVTAQSTATDVTVIDGGDGVDTVASTLLNAGNAAQFKNFEILGLGNNVLDASLITASTITGLELVAGGGTFNNVTQAQSLAVNTNTAGTTTLAFSGVTGTADAYSITFGANTTGTAASPTAIGAGTLSLAGIENVTIHSGAAAGVVNNSIALTDAAAKTLTIDGAQALGVTFVTGFGTAGATTGVTTIDGSAATGKLSINLANVNAAAAGITVKGGSAVDTLTTGAFSSTLTGNGGNDIFDVRVTTSNVTAGAGATQAAVLDGSIHITTISDLTKGDTISLLGTGLGGTNTFSTTKVDVSAAQNLGAALDLAAAGAGTATAALTKWFTWGNDVYLVEDRTAGATVATTDVIVKLAGVSDLSTSGVAAANHLTNGDVFTFA